MTRDGYHSRKGQYIPPKGGGAPKLIIKMITEQLQWMFKKQRISICSVVFVWYAAREKESHTKRNRVGLNVIVNMFLFYCY